MADANTTISSTAGGADGGAAAPVILAQSTVRPIAPMAAASARTWACC